MSDASLASTVKRNDRVSQRDIDFIAICATNRRVGR